MRTTTMIERELVRLAKNGDAQASLVLWKQYERLVHKHWHVLRKQMNTSHIVMGYKDDFYSDAYISFSKALQAVNLQKVKDDNWKFLGYFGWYLQTLRTNAIKKLLNTRKHEESLQFNPTDGSDGSVLKTDIDATMITGDPADVIALRVDMQRVRATWDKPRQFIFDQLALGTPKKEIAAALQVHPSMITFYLKSMKKDLQTIL